MKYYDNNEAHGVIYDWGKIKKRYDALGVPDEFYEIPWQAIKAGNKYLVTQSVRKTGKTTNWLLLGLCINAEYPGRPVQYVRETEDMLAPKFAAKLVDVIRSYDSGKYVKILTDGKWNSIYYHWQAFYYCNVDENGNIIEKSNEECIHCLAVTKWADYKSGYNTLSDFVLFDEFIGPHYLVGSWLNFCQITSTCFRFRLGGIIVMCANNINPNSMYFEELMVSREVKKLTPGDSTQVITPKGTKIYLEMVDSRQRQKNGIRERINGLFYGFSNTALASITGADVYAFDSYPHIPPRTDGDGWEVILNNLYIETGTELLRLNYCYSNALGNHFEIHKATRTYPDSEIFTLATVEDSRYHWGFGDRYLAHFFDDLITEHRFYFSSNEVGGIFNDYLQRYLQQRRKLN